MSLCVRACVRVCVWQICVCVCVCVCLNIHMCNCVEMRSIRIVAQIWHTQRHMRTKHVKVLSSYRIPFYVHAASNGSFSSAKAVSTSATEPKADSCKASQRVRGCKSSHTADHNSCRIADCASSASEIQSARRGCTHSSHPTSED